MKYLSILFCLCLTTSLFGQSKVKFGIYLSSDRSFFNSLDYDFSGDYQGGLSFEVIPKKAFSLGSIINIPISKKFAFQTGLQFTQKSFDIDYKLTDQEFDQETGFFTEIPIVKGIETVPYQTLSLPFEGLFYIHSENIPTFALFLKFGYRLDYIFSQDQSAYMATAYEGKETGVKQSYNNLKTIDHGFIAGLGLEKGLGKSGTIHFSLAYNFLFTKSVHFDVRAIEAPLGTTNYTENPNFIFMDRGNTLMRMELSYFVPF